MKKTEKIKYQQKVIAYIIRPKLINEKEHQFFGADSDYIQVGVHNKNKKNTIQPHFNIKNSTKINEYQEFVFVTKGKVKINFFNDSGEFIKSAILETGEGVALIAGGHGFEFLKKTQLVEIKQGPFSGKSCIRIHDKSK